MPLDDGQDLIVDGKLQVPGVFMYHCASGVATDQHIKMGMFGTMIVYPRAQKLRPAREIESKFGEWTHCEAICKGDTLEYRVNGKLVNKAFDLSVTRGKLLFQTEGAEVWYRDILLTPLA